MNAWNERKNDFRSVPRAEVEADHLFKATRHFPELRQSLRGVSSMQRTHGRDMLTTRKMGSGTGGASIKRTRQYKSTAKLDSLTGSVLDQLTSMKSICGVLTGERARQRDQRHNERDLPEDSMLHATPLQKANHKLTKTSISYDGLSANNDLSGFQDGPSLTIDEFEAQLRRCLNITLPKDQLTALFESMDADGSGDVDGVEFTRYFFKLGSDRLASMRQAEAERLEKEEKIRLKIIETEKQRRRDWEAAQIHVPTADDMTTMYKKLRYFL